MLFCIREHRLHKAIQDLECRVCLERIANGAPRFVVRTEAMPRPFQFNETFVLSESTRDCSEFPVLSFSDDCFRSTHSRERNSQFHNESAWSGPDSTPCVVQDAISTSCGPDHLTFRNMIVVSSFNSHSRSGHRFTFLFEVLLLRWESQ
jgi:hypothetical protein